MHPLVRLQFRGSEASERTAFLFEHVVDVKGNKYDMPVAVGCMAASKEIYALGMQCAPEEIGAKWGRALVKPIPPTLVSAGPAQEVVHSGADLGAKFGLQSLPIPISTPGFDNAPYTTASHFVSRDPETGTRNLGNYRGQAKSPVRMGCCAGIGIRSHWQKWKKMGKKEMDVAIVMGVTPNLCYTATARVPEEVEEYGVAGGIAGAPVELVQCKTVDLQVPANAEIVIEGRMPTDELEMEGPFGEFPGFMAQRAMNVFMDVTCITHRVSPIYLAFISQFPPSESSVLRGVAREQLIKKFLLVDCKLKGIRQVALHEATGSWGLCVVQIDQNEGGKGSETVEAMKRSRHLLCKWVVVVDDDVNPHDADAVHWAMSFRTQPRRYLGHRHVRHASRSVAVPQRREDRHDRRRSRCLGADDRRDPQVALSAGVPPEPASHGAGAEDLEGRRPAGAKAKRALVRLLPRLLERGGCRGGGSRAQGRAFQDRGEAGEVATNQGLSPGSWDALLQSTRMFICVITPRHFSR